MSEFDVKFREAVQKATNDTLLMEVVSIDRDNLTCNLDSLIEGVVGYEGVSLCVDATGDTYYVPKVGSNVLIRTFGTDKDSALILQCSEVDEIVFRGGDLGGLIKIEELKTQLEKINTFITQFKQVLAVPIPEPGNGNPSAFQASLNGVFSSFVNPNYSNIENEKITHG